MGALTEAVVLAVSVICIVVTSVVIGLPLLLIILLALMHK